MKISLILILLLPINHVLNAQLDADFTLSKSNACVGETITLTSTSTASGSTIVNYVWSAQGAVIESQEGTANTFSFTYSNPGTYNLGLIIQDNNGIATNEFKMNVLTIHANPIAQITSTIASCTAPFDVNYTIGNSSTGPTISYNWTFPGGSPSAATNNPNPLISYPNPGTVSANLVVTNSFSGCSTSADASVILTNYTADFSLPESGCSGETFNFTDNSTAGTNQWLWSVSSGDGGTTQNLSLPIHISGNITVTLLATNTNTGCSSSVSQVLFVKPLPQPDFLINPSLSCSPVIVNFTNNSPNNANDIYTWSYGDGLPDFTGYSSPAHTYSNNNSIFFPSLTILAANGCTGTFMGDTVLIFNPEAYFSFDKIDGCAPISVQFNNESFEPSPIVSYLWEFGDGTTSNLQNPAHVYQCGIFNPKLTIQDDKGCIDSIELNQQHYNFLFDGPTIIGYTNRPDTFLLQINQPSIIRMPQNMEDYLGVGQINDHGIRTDIRFGTLVPTNFETEPRVQCASLPVTFTGLDTDCPHQNELQYIWYFEGFGYISPYTGGIVTDVTFIIDPLSHHDTLRTNSLMDVSLEIMFRGCLSPRTTKADEVYLIAPRSFFTAKSFCNVGPGPHQLVIDDSSSIYGHQNALTVLGIDIPSQAEDDVEVTYSWGDGTQTTITEDNLLEDADKGAASHIYPVGYGTYTINQLITNHTTGCSDQKDIVVSISHVETDFVFDIAGNDSVCYQNPFTFTEISSTFIPHEPLAFEFRFFKNGSFYDDFKGSDPNSTFSSTDLVEFLPGVYNTMLITENAVGCKDTTFNSITVFELPVAQISLSEDTICKNTDASFDASFSAFGGYNSGWQDFMWSFDDGSTNVNTNGLNQTVTHPVAENLTVYLKATDGFGCVSANTDSVKIVGVKPLAEFSNKAYLCNGVDETIDGSSSSGIGTLTYSWYLNDNLLNSSVNPVLTNTINVSPPDTSVMEYEYALIVTDSYGCQDTVSKPVFVSNPHILNVDTLISAKYIDANGFFTCPPVVVDFSISYESFWGVSTFQWSLGNDFDEDIDSYNENPTGIQYVRAGSYSYTANLTESVTSCPFSISESPFLVIGGPSAEIKITADSTDICGMRYFFEITEASENLDRWTWDLDDGTFEYDSTNISNNFYHTYLDNTSYNPTIYLIDDSTNCIVPVNETVQTIGNDLEAFFTVDSDVIVIGMSAVFHDDSHSPNTQIVNWIWDFDDGLIDTLTNNNVLSHQYLDTEYPIVLLTIVDEFGCTDQYSLPLTVKIEAIFPNIITNAGGNGVNSSWTLFADIFENFELLIVNRWGNLVYEGSRDPGNPTYLWDGIDYKSLKPCVDGTYFYIINGTLINGKKYSHQDFLTLVGHQ